MTIRKPLRRNRDFQHNGGFGPNTPIIEPAIEVTVKFNKNGNPATLHTIIKIHGVHGESEFLYMDEENIEFIPEMDEAFGEEVILNEVRNSINRCFDDSYNSCVRYSFAFPFSKKHPANNVDLNTARKQIEKDLS